MRPIAFQSLQFTPRGFTRHFCLMLIVWLMIWQAAAASPADPVDGLLTQAQTALEAGQTARAVEIWERALLQIEHQGLSGQQIQTLLALAQGYRSLGHPLKAEARLQTGLQRIRETGDSSELPAFLGALGDLYLEMGNLDQAAAKLREGLVSAEKSGDPALLSAFQISLGTLAALQQDHNTAATHFTKALDLARQAKDKRLLAKAGLNLARSAMSRQAYSEAARMIAGLLPKLERLAPNLQTADAWVSLGVLSTHLLEQAPRKRKMLKIAYQALQKAQDIADRHADPALLSLCFGHLGHLYEVEKRSADALRLSRQALFQAQKIREPELMYQWSWQIGRLLNGLNDIQGAISSYREAVYHLATIREDLAAGCRYSRLSFRETIGPIYFELADLLLRQSARVDNSRMRQNYLMEARDTVEHLKAAEIQDYYQDACVTALQSKMTDLDRIASHTATLYPVILKDRLDLLVGLPSGLKRFSVAVDEATLTREINRLRLKLQYPTVLFRRHAARLYDWLIRPLEAELTAAGIDTLVFVPDGALRTIPISVLLDGDSFLIERYAVVTSPGLTLTDPHPLEHDQILVLMAGVTEAVQGFSALPNVAFELNQVADLYSGKVLQDKSFTIQDLETELRRTPYTIVHIASHGNFDKDPQKSFILAHDEKVHMDILRNLMALGRFREKPVELLMLSACQTAVGDDRAALGLAGIALKAGARSAIATLWFVNDEATSRLVVEFYRQLQKGGQSKAGALQQAQLSLMHQTGFKHPAFWAPFLLIGNWL